MKQSCIPIRDVLKVPGASDASQFETLMGRAHVGTVHADLSETSLLTVTDDIGTGKFRMSMDTICVL